MYPFPRAPLPVNATLGHIEDLGFVVSIRCNDKRDSRTGSDGLSAQLIAEIERRWPWAK